MIKYWYDDDKSKIFRTSRCDVAHLEVSPLSRKPGLFREECRNVARELADQYPSISLGLTGGWHSQIILQSLLDIGFKPNIFVMSLPKNLNVFDTYWAKDLAKRYSLQCNVIDVPGQIMIQSSKISSELKQREPWSTALESQIYTYYDMLMAHCIGKIDEPVLIGDQLNFRRDVDPGSAWCLILDENSYFWPRRYCSIHPDKTIISNFFTRSSEIVYSFINDASVRDVTSDTGNGKITLVSSRQQIFGSQGFHKRGPSQRTISNINIPGLHETNSDWLQDTLGFHNRYFYLDINKFTNSVEEKSTVWSYV